MGPHFPNGSQTPKTVLLYTDSHSFCGVGRFNAALMSSLCTAGYRVLCGQKYEQTPLQTDLQNQGVAYHWFSYDPDQQMDQFARDQEPARDLFLRTQPDLIVFANGFPTNTYAAITAARELNIRYLIWEGHVRQEAFSGSAFPPEAVQRNYVQAAAVVCVAQQNLDVIRSHFALPDDFGQVIYTFAAKAFYKTPEAQRRIQLRAKWGVPADGVVCFTSAKFEPVKGYEILIRALENLRQTPLWQRLYFVWAGDGTYRAAVSHRLIQLDLKDHVHLLGHVWDVADYLDGADLFALTSFAEGMPLTLLEAMAKGLPAIATDVGGNREALEGCGEIISAPSDVEKTAGELAHTLAAWAVNSERRQALANAAKNRARDLFSEETIMAQHLALIKHLLR